MRREDAELARERRIEIRYGLSAHSQTDNQQ
jgi:hypothetical protein